MKYVIVLTLAIAGAFGGNIFGDHTDPHGSVGLLGSESQELDQMVRYSPLNYNVKSAVDRFNYDVRRLVDCVQFGFNDRSHLDDHTGTVGCPARCQGYLNYARSSFYDVERYLHDTQFDFPQIYRQYLEVRRALYGIAVGPGPQPHTKVRCVATDTGWEEHSGGHVAYSYYLEKAQQLAINECRRYHGRCRIYRCENVN